MSSRDMDAALKAVNVLADGASQRTGLKTRIPARPKMPTQVTSLETDLMNSVGILKSRNRIFGESPTIEDLLDPAEEREIGDYYEFPGGDKEIAEEVRRRIATTRGDIMEVDSDSEDDEPKTPDYTLTQVISLCRQLEDACLQFGDLGESFDLSKRLRKFRACVHREEIRELKQTTVDFLLQTVNSK